MKSMVYDFAPTGEVSGLHRDSFSLAFLGKQSIKRASEIWFNEDSQLWDVILPGEDKPIPESAGFDTYESARTFEAHWLDVCRLYMVDPLSDGGRGVAISIREELPRGRGLL